MKIPMYEKQVREVGGAKMPSAPLLSGTPVSQGSEISKIASNLLNVTGGLMEKYQTKLDDQEKMNIADKFYIDYSQEHTALIQSSKTSQQLIKGREELDEKFSTRANESKYRSELNHLYATLKVPNDKKLSNLAFSMKGVELTNELLSNVQNTITSDMPVKKKRESIEATLRSGVANLIITKPKADQIMETFNHDVEHSDAYKLMLQDPGLFISGDEFSEEAITKKDFPNLSVDEFEKFKSKAKSSVDELEKVKSKAKSKAKQADHDAEYSDLYKRWKAKQKRFGYTHPSETTEDEFKSWMDDQIDYIWDPGYKGMDPGYKEI